MNAFLSDQVVQALGWALVHSLWQAGLIAALLYLLLPRVQEARRKYWLAYGALLMVFGAATGTFCWYQTPEPASAAPTWVWQPDNSLAPAEATSALKTLPLKPLASETPWREEAAIWLEARYPYLVACWLFGLGFFCLRLAGGLYYVRRLRRQGVSEAPFEWQECKRDFCERLGIRRTVALLESSLAPVPMAVGLLKPMVLFPVGLINQLNPVEAEAILAHELAHLAHRDWLFNLLQACIESLFYHHPAVWWISGVIRSERENRCDDAAVALTGKRLAYAKALVVVQERAQMPAPIHLPALYWQGAPTLLRPRPRLLDRVKRILHQPTSSSPTMEKLIATVLLLALLLFCGLRANKDNPIFQSALAQIPFDSFQLLEENATPVLQDSIPKGKKNVQKIVREDDKQRVEMELNRGVVTRLNIDGKEIPKEDFEKYADLTREIRDEVRPPEPPFPAMAPFPAAAPFPPGAPFPAIAPLPGIGSFSPAMPMDALEPIAPIAPAPPRISASKDKDGNVLLKIDRAGEPLELLVKDGAAWYNGRKLEEGETLELMGMEDKGFFFWEDDEGHKLTLGKGHFQFGDDIDEGQNWRVYGKEQLEALRENAHNLAQEYREKWKMNEDVRREAEQALRAAQREIEVAQREMARELRNSQDELRRASAEMQQAQREVAEALQRGYAKGQAYSGNRSYSDGNRAYSESRSYAEGRASAGGDAADLDETFRNHFLEDGLIDNPRKYSFELKADKLKVNGKKQPDAVLEKYLELYKSVTGKKMGKSDAISYSVDED